MSDVTAPGKHQEADVHELRALGFWIYLMSDALIFALLFATYGVMVGNTAGGPSGRALFDLDNVAIETALLLVSSITFGFASLSARAGARGASLGWLSVTFLLGAGFVFLEIREFTGMIRAGLTVGVGSRLHRLALFWHFLDIAWIGIFSVVYLPGLI